MAGAKQSGQEMQTGRTNRAESHTILWAQVPPQQSNFNGQAILVVEVAKDPVDSDDYEAPGGFVPSNRFHGIFAKGHSGTVPFGGTPGAAGVIGRGGSNHGTGVVGVGGGKREPGNDDGSGGIGVHGLGGGGEDSRAFGKPADNSPGVGVIGQGGRQLDGANSLRLPHAAGVIGIAGGTGSSVDLLAAHDLTQTGGVGIYGQGAEMTVIEIRPPPDDTGASIGPNVASGPPVPGAGVLGRGGLPVPLRGPVAAGVIGLAGGVLIPDIAETGDRGVYGAGPTGVFGRGSVGVRGQSDSGPGIHGVADSGRGGMFESARSAQVHLVPRLVATSAAPVAVTPKAIPVGPESEGPELPKDGRGGDLLALMDNQRECTLWFCVRGEDDVPARWAQLLLGTSFDGRG